MSNLIVDIVYGYPDIKYFKRITPDIVHSNRVGVLQAEAGDEGGEEGLQGRRFGGNIALFLL